MKKPKQSGTCVQGVSLTHDLANYLKGRAKTEDKTVSQILRGLIREDMKARGQ